MPASSSPAPSAALRRLARLHGVQTVYYDIEGERQPATSEALRRTISALVGEELKTDADFAESIRSRESELASRMVDPVTVCWGGRCSLLLRLSEASWSGQVELATQAEGGSGPRSTWTVDVADLPVVKRRTSAGAAVVSRVCELPENLPIGYHEITITISGRTATTFAISSPVSAFRPPAKRRRWGVFAPLYAIQTDRSWGAGDLTDLRSFMDWVHELGGDMVATLPLLPPQSENSDDPSPYSAGSRLMWNDLYLDLDPHVDGGPIPDEAIASLRRRPSVDYEALRPLRRQVLQRAADFAYAERKEAMRASADATPGIVDYAAFQSRCERTGKTWFEWEQPDRIDVDWNDAIFRRHVFAQLELRRQLDAVAEHAETLDQTWYLDYPLGVNAAGYDVWKYRDQFVLGASGGSPPDAFFTKGQNWGFPPLHPEGIREDGYRYFRDTLRHHLRYARLLRFDHVMGLARLFWVPHGLDARDGAYVRYPMDELIAILCVESARHEAELVGENLGTVPPAIDAALPRHGIGGIFVTQFGLNPEAAQPVGTPGPLDIASVNTHDMPTFEAFRTGADVDDRVDLGLMDEAEAAAERANRTKAIDALRRHVFPASGQTTTPDGPSEDLLAAVLADLGRSESPVVLASLDDLVDELVPQNTPGTFKERPNWSRKVAATLASLRSDERVRSRLTRLDRSRQQTDVIPMATEPEPET